MSRFAIEAERGVVSADEDVVVMGVESAEEVGGLRASEKSDANEPTGAEGGARPAATSASSSSASSALVPEAEERSERACVEEIDVT